MKKIYAVFIVCFIVIIASVGACSGSVEIKKETQTNSDGTKEVIFYTNGNEVARQKLGKYGELLESSGTIPDGVATEYYPSGKVHAVTPYKNGKPDGLAKSYYENGQVKFEVTFVNNKKEGLSKWYYENGQLKNESNYKNEKLHGLYKDYYGNGQLESERTYKNGEWDGPRKEYYKDGMLKWSAVYADGKEVSSEYYGPKNSQYYSDLKKAVTMFEKMKGTVERNGDVSYDQFNSWFKEWMSFNEAFNEKYGFGSKDTPYTSLDSHKFLEEIDSNLYYCELDLSSDDLEKMGAQRRPYPTKYTGKHKGDFWKNWSDFLQNLEKLKKAISERK